MKKWFFIFCLLGLVVHIYAIDFIPHFSDEDINIYLSGNSTLGYGQYHSMNNVGDVLYVAANFDVVGGYSFSNHVYYWNPSTNDTVNLTPDMGGYWDYYAQALNDHGHYFYYGNKKNSSEVRNNPYVYGLNNNNEYLYLPQYSTSYFIGNEGGIRFNEERALFLNDNREIAGYIKTSNRYRAVRISDISINRDFEESTYYEETLNLVGNNNSSFPTGIDAQGNIVGWMYRDTSDGSEQFTYAKARATLWTDSEIIDLGFPDVTVRSSSIYRSSDYGLFINDNGDVVQISGQGVFLNQHGIVTDLTPMIIDCIEWDASWERWGQDMGILDVSNYGILMYHDYP